MSHKQRNRRVLDHELEAVLWILGIERKVDCSALENRQQGNYRIEGAIEIDADDSAGAGSKTAQEMSQAIRSGIQFPVSNPLLPIVSATAFGVRSTCSSIRLCGARMNGFSAVTLEWICEFCSHLGPRLHFACQWQSQF